MLYITSYSNPDTDGVATALGYRCWREAFSNTNGVVIVFGQLQAETRFALEYTGYNHKIKSTQNMPSDCTELVLVDSHHPEQLHPSLRLELVSEVIDHHSAGSPRSFPNAKIQNEMVGAAATLIAERLGDLRAKTDAPLALLLATGIYSNTLGFRAPATTERDRKAFLFLISYCGWSRSFVHDLERARMDEMLTYGENILFSDVKVFDLTIGAVVVFQVERQGIIDLFPSQRIVQLLRERREAEGREVILVLVDLGSSKSRIYCMSRMIIEYFLRSLQEATDCDEFVEVNYLIQRKTHIAPVLSELKGI